MRPVLTAEQMAQIDLRTVDKYGIPSLILMENAAHAVVRVIVEKLGGSVSGRSILVICGPGNNGGDGAAIARILWTLGAFVEVVLIGRVEAITGDAGTNFQILQKLSENEKFGLDQSDIAFEEISTLEQWLEYDSVNFHADDPDLVVDALFGTGLTRPLDGVYAQVAAFLAAYCSDDDGCSTRVIAVDIPSGLNADVAEPIGVTPTAHVTVTFTAPKPANVLPPASRYSGELLIAGIGSPMEVVEEAASDLYVAEASDVVRWMQATGFAPGSYKNRRGHALIVAGSRDYSGAAVLCGDAAIRSGIGLVTLAVPRGCDDSVAARVASEVMVRGLNATESGCVSISALEEIRKLAASADSLAIGSGLSSEGDETRTLIETLVSERRTPIVLDADALTALSPLTICGDDANPIILTPHQGEFMRLIGRDASSSLSDRVGSVRDLARSNHVIVVLKGERLLIASPEGRVVIIPRGNPAVGKAGNGDTLTGIIVGCLAQGARLGVDVCETVICASFIAAVAGDLATQRVGARTLRASDVKDSLADAFAAFDE